MCHVAAGQTEPQTKMIMLVRGELVVEVPQDEVEWVRVEIARLMAGVAQLKVPLLAEIGVGGSGNKRIEAH